MQGVDTSEHDIPSERLPPIFRFLNLNHGQDTRANLSGRDREITD